MTAFSPGQSPPPVSRPMRVTGATLEWTRMRRGTAAIAVCASLLLAACGDERTRTESLITGDSLTVYSSLPLHGPHTELSHDLVRAEKLALKEAGGVAGEYAVGLASLDSSDPATGRWSPRRVAGNARTAVQGERKSAG